MSIARRSRRKKEDRHGDAGIVSVMRDLDRSLLGRRVERLLVPWGRRSGPGVAIGVVLGHELVVHASTGMASIEHSAPIGPNTTFRIASVSKQFTCAAILMLVQEERFPSKMMFATTFRRCPTSTIASRSPI